MTTTNNALNNTLSGQTGTGAVVGSVSPTLSSPTLNTPTIALTAAGVSAAFTDITGSITVTGFSGSPTILVRQCLIGKFVYLSFSITGTSNATSFTITGMPVAAHNQTYIPILVTDSGSNDIGLFSINSTTVLFYQSNVTNPTSWTASGTKSAYGSIFYEAT